MLPVMLVALGVLVTGAAASAARNSRPATSIRQAAAAASIDPSTVTVNADDNIWGAGLTAPPDPGGGGGGELPVDVPLPPTASQLTVTLSNVTGSISCCSGANANGPDGQPGGTNISGYGGLSGITDGSDRFYLVGVFLANGQPSTPPPTLDFTDNHSFSTLPPALGQVFFMGDGLTGTGTGDTQQFIAPVGATDLYLGIPDALGFSGNPGFYGDNVGSLNATVNFGTAQPLAICTLQFNPATVGVAYTQDACATGGTPPYTWSVTSGQIPTGLQLLNGFEPQISGTPQYAGTYYFTLTVTDHSGQTAQASFSIAVNAPSQQQFSLTYKGGPVLVSPNVAIVLVDPSWWSPGITTPSSEPATLFGAISNLVTRDFSSEYDAPLSHYYETTGAGPISVGPGLSLCTYSSGNTWYGPVPASSVSTASSLTTFLGDRRSGLISTLRPPCSSNQDDVANTVFLLLYAPTLLTCPDMKTTNTTVREHHVAYVYLEDTTAGQNCGLLPPPQFVPPSQIDVKLQEAVDFATLSVSHELVEAITDPLVKAANGWTVQVLSGNQLLIEQIADFCADRNGNGQTGLGPPGYPFVNYPRDSLGTVVAPYVDGGSQLTSGPCSPDVSTGIPPG
jgi:hypothetical protein